MIFVATDSDYNALAGVSEHTDFTAAVDQAVDALKNKGYEKTIVLGLETDKLDNHKAWQFVPSHVCLILQAGADLRRLP